MAAASNDHGQSSIRSQHPRHLCQRATGSSASPCRSSSPARAPPAYRSATCKGGSARRIEGTGRSASRPIAKGRLGKPAEFSYKGQIVDNDDGIVLDVQAGNPSDAPQLAPAIQRVKNRAGRAPRTVTTDRGYGEAAVDDALANLGVRTVVIPHEGNPARPDNSWNDAEPSAEPSNGEPDAKAASAPCNAHTAGTAPACTVSRERKAGPDKGYTPTT